MLNLRRLVITLLVTAACSSAAAPHAPDASAPPAPLDPAGRYAVRTAWSLAAPPAGAGEVLAELASATDGPDDPSRYLIDRLVARLPDGQARTIATALAPYVAAYVNARIDRVAPRFTAGVRALASGLQRSALQFETSEELVVDDAYAARRTITGFGFDAIEVPFAAHGAADVSARTAVLLDGDRLAIAAHTVQLPYGMLLRLALDRAIVPRVVAGTQDLTAALVALVDCDALGGVIAEYLGLGTPGLYATACTVAMTALAAEVYDRLQAPDVRVEVHGLARAIDLDGDGPIDVLADGAWIGTFADAPLASASFDGSAP